MLRGFVDIVSPAEMHGWVVDEAAVNGRSQVEVFLDEARIGAGWANLPRTDLHALGLGACGFQIDLTRPLTLIDQLGRLRLAVNGQLWAPELRADQPGVTLPFRIGPAYAVTDGFVVEVVSMGSDWTGEWPVIDVRATPSDARIEIRRERRGQTEAHRIRHVGDIATSCIVDIGIENLTVANGVPLDATSAGALGDPPPVGAVETLGPGFIAGWMSAAAGPAGQGYTVQVDGESIGSGVANRPGVAGLAERTADIGRFQFPLPRRFADGRFHTVEVTRAADGAVLTAPAPGFVVGEHRMMTEWRVDGLLVTIEGPPGAEAPGSTVDVELNTDGQPVLTRSIRLQPGERFSSGSTLFDRSAMSVDSGRPLRVVCPALGVATTLVAGTQGQVLYGELEGNLDLFDGVEADGWCAYALQLDLPVVLDVFVGDAFVGEVVASNNRPDLADAGRASACHGFRFRLPSRVLDGSRRQLTFRDRRSGSPVPGTPRLVTLGKDVVTTRPGPRRSIMRELTSSAPVNAGRTGPAAVSPEVTIVILTRDGAEVLARCLESLWWFVPRDLFQIVLIDHGSSDETDEVVAAWSERLAIRHVKRVGNNAFSFGNNAAVREYADTPLVLLLNNDIVLISDVVTAMASALRAETGVGLVGCRLIEARDLSDLSGATVHHGGIQLGLDRDGVVRGHEASVELRVSEANRAVEPFSVTGACAMLRTADYLAVGGLEEAYFYDSEDVELGERIRVRLGKSVLCLNGVTALHYRGWYRMSARGNAAAARMQANDGVLLKRVGHQMKKRHQRALYSPSLDWSLGKAVIGFVVLDAFAAPGDAEFRALSDLASALEAKAQLRTVLVEPEAGWYDADGLTCLVVTPPEYNVAELVNARPDLLRIAWIRDDVERWLREQPLDAYDLILCRSASDVEAVASAGLQATLFETPVDSRSALEAVDVFRAALETRFDVARVAIKIGAPDQKSAAAWGDTYLARDLARRLRRRGVRVTVDTLDRWHAGGDLVDAVIVLRGLSRYQPRPEDLNLLWLVSHPDGVSLDELRSFDKVAFASQALVDRFGDLDGRSLLARQFSGFAATPPTLTPAQQSLLAGLSLDDVLVVGNTRGVRREFILHAQRLTPMKFIGAGWDHYVSADRILAEFVDNDALPAFYQRALAVVNDHWPDMAASGIVSNRIADVLASGGLVLSDWNAEGAALFGEELFFRTPEDLVAAIDQLRRDPRERGNFIERLAARAEVVMSGEAAADGILVALSDAHQRRFEGWIPGG